jgi:hypothetical protein
MSGRWVTRLPDLLLALEEAAARADHKQVRPVDGHIAAFIAARSERRLDSDLAALTGPSGDAASLAQMRILAQIQTRYRVPALPRLAGWLAEQAEPALAAWRNRANRAAIAERLQILAKAGFLPPILALLDDPVERDADARDAQRAAAEIACIDAELAHIAAGAEARTGLATRVGQEIAAGIGLATLAIMLAAMALG